MPTHQGQTQTDIVIGDAGDSITSDASIEFTVSYDDDADFQYKNNAPSGDAEDSSYEIEVKDATGTSLGTFAAEYTFDPVTGTATNVSSTRTNTFTPSPDGNTPSFPSSWETLAERTWEISSTKGTSTFAGFEGRWKFASTVASGGSVSQTVNTQNDDELKVTLSYSDGSSTVATVVVICKASASGTSGVTLGSPSVSDSLRP